MDNSNIIMDNSNIIMDNSNIILVIVACLVIISIGYFIYKKYFSNNTINNSKNDINDNHLLDQCFYDYNKVYPELESLKTNRNLIMEEIKKINADFWNDWPEKKLYTEDMSWKVFPFYGFDTWIEHNCNLCPEITKILKQIPNLKTASLSKLDAGTKLKPHKGWANLSNYVLRCHYGLIVPDKCSIYVENQEKQMLDNEIIVFDDSKIHSASNYGDSERIVLILDIKRPNYIVTRI